MTNPYQNIIKNTFYLWLISIAVSINGISFPAKNPLIESRTKSIIGPAVSQEQIDGNEFPKTYHAMVESLKKEVPDLVIKTKNRTTKRIRSFLKIREESDINRAFFALQKIFYDNIKCDTASLLVSHQITGKNILLSDLYHFLINRALIPDEKPVSITHLYHKYNHKLRSKISKPLFNENYLTLRQILPENNDSAIVEIARHSGVITRIDHNTFLFFGWNQKKGIFPYILDVPEYEFYDDIWQNMDIIEYTLIPKSTNYNLSILQKTDCNSTTSTLTDTEFDADTDTHKQLSSPFYSENLTACGKEFRSEDSTKPNPIQSTKSTSVCLNFVSKVYNTLKILFSTKNDTLN